MLHRELNNSLPTSVCRSVAAVPTPIKNNSSRIEKKCDYENNRQYGEVPFFPSSSPPVSDFLKRLEQRNMCYNR